MTRQELSQIRALETEIKKQAERLREMEENATRATHTPGSIPRGSGVADRTGKYAPEIADLKEVLRGSIERARSERERLVRYITGIEDSLTRQVLSSRYLDGMSWIQVAMAVGGGNTEDGVKKLCYRYLERSEKKKGRGKAG